MPADTESPHARHLSRHDVTPLPSARVPARSTMTGRYVALEPMDEAVHGDALYAASHETPDGLAIWEYLPAGPWPDRAGYGQELRSMSAMHDRIAYALRDLDSGTVGGQATFMDMRPLEGVIEIGYIWFGPALQRTRAATEALYLMIDHAMTDLGYRRMQWRCNAMNARSRAAALRLGFRYEGTFFNHMIVKGKNRDTAWYSILDDEWPQNRACLQAWLTPDNFGPDGRALRSLRALMDARTPVGRAVAADT